MPTSDEEGMRSRSPRSESVFRAERKLREENRQLQELVNELANKNKVLNGRIAEPERAAESRHGEMVGYFKALGANIESIKRGPASLQPNSEENKMGVETSTTKRATKEEEQPFPVVAKKRPQKQRETEAQASCSKSNQDNQPRAPQAPAAPPKLPRIPPVVLRKQERWGQISKGLNVVKIGYTKAKMVGKPSR